MEIVKQHYFKKRELILWSLSTLLIVFSFFIFKSTDYLTLVASLTGATSLIFSAKGNPVGQVLMIIFSLLYGIISFEFSYYGEMLTYVGMTMPMAVFSLFAWLKNPYKGNKSEVKVNRINKYEHLVMWVLTAVVTVLFYFILKYFNTANIILSTISVMTSFVAVYLTARRSPYYAIGYAANDVVLIVLWIMAACCDRKYVSVVVCFTVFLVNDIYGFISWKELEKKQKGL